MKLKMTKYADAPDFGTWGEWAYGKDHGTFGCSIKGMWARKDGEIFMGVETYEQDVTESFKQSVIKWRNLNRRLSKFMKAR